MNRRHHLDVSHIMYRSLPLCRLEGAIEDRQMLRFQMRRPFDRIVLVDENATWSTELEYRLPFNIGRCNSRLAFRQHVSAKGWLKDRRGLLYSKSVVEDWLSSDIRN